MLDKSLIVNVVIGIVVSVVLLYAGWNLWVDHANTNAMLNYLNQQIEQQKRANVPSSAQVVPPPQKK